MAYNIRLLLSCILLCLSLGAYATEYSVTYVPISSSAVEMSGDAPDGAVATFVKTGAGAMPSRLLAGETACLQLAGFDGKIIKSITLRMKSNKSSGAGSLTITCGNTALSTIDNASFANKSWAGKYQMNLVDIKPDIKQYKVGEGEVLTINLMSSQNSIYCTSYTITYDDTDPIIPDKTTVAALAGTYASKLYAMSTDDLSAVEVTTLNGKIIADADMKERLTWNVYDVKDNSIICNNAGKYLSFDGSSLCLSDAIYKWNIDEDNCSWQKSGCTFAQSNNKFIYTSTSNIGEKYFQSDHTKAYDITDGYVRSGLTIGKFATVCLPSGVEEGDFSGAEIYEIIGVVKDTEDMTVNDITGLAVKEVTSLVAGTPYIMMPTSSSLVAIYDDTKEDNPVSATGLVGNLSGEKMYVPASDDTHWNYILNNNQLRKVVSGVKASIANNRAYIDLYGVPRYDGDVSSVKIILLNDEASGIGALSADNEESAAFAIDGRRACPSHMHKGIYVKDGKKYLDK